MDKLVTNKTSKKTSKARRNAIATTTTKTRNSVCCMEKTYAHHQTVPYLKMEAEKHKKSCENGEKKTSKRGYHPTKEEIHVLAAFAKDALKRENRKVDKELANFGGMSVSGDEKDEK